MQTITVRSPSGRAVRGVPYRPRMKNLPPWVRKAWARLRAADLSREAFGDLEQRAASESWPPERHARELALLNDRDFYAEAMREARSDVMRPRIVWWHKCLMEAAYASGKSQPDEALTT